MNEEYSESGDPIYRHEPRDKDWTLPDMEDSCIEEISDHIEKHIGPIDMVWHEIVSDLVHIDVYQVAPREERPYWTLITSGMSDLPMKAPDGMKGWEFAELMICLPRDWDVSDEGFKDNKNYWPVRWLKILARFPHEYDTWFSWGHTIPNGDPAEPFDESVPFTCLLLSRPRTVSTDFWTLEIREAKTIHFFSLMPLYTSETEFKLKNGTDDLEELFERNKVTEILDISRPEVLDKPWWRIW